MNKGEKTCVYRFTLFSLYYKNRLSYIRMNEERLGQKFKTKYGTEYEIIEYNGWDDVVIQFNDEYKYTYTARYDHIRKGNVKNPYDKSVCGVGCVGLEILNKYYTESESYKTWNRMIHRCYDGKKPTYKKCSVCEEWLNYSVFKKWFDENYYIIPNHEKDMELDKDILIKNNTIYSPLTCVFVPHIINTTFTKANKSRRLGLPIGVERTKCGSYIARYHKCHIGTYKTLEEAFVAYKKHKEQTIKHIAEEYKNLIPQKLYEALINYEVEITD